MLLIYRPVHIIDGKFHKKVNQSTNSKDSFVPEVKGAMLQHILGHSL